MASKETPTTVPEDLIQGAQDDGFAYSLEKYRSAEPGTESQEIFPLKVGDKIVLRKKGAKGKDGSYTQSGGDLAKGVLLSDVTAGNPIVLDSGLRTGRVEKVEYNKSLIIIETENSIYEAYYLRSSSESESSEKSLGSTNDESVIAKSIDEPAQLEPETDPSQAVSEAAIVPEVVIGTEETSKRSPDVTLGDEEVKAAPNTDLNKAIEDVKAGNVSSLTSSEDDRLTDDWRGFEKAVKDRAADQLAEQPLAPKEETVADEVYSIKTGRPVNPDAPRGIVNQQLRDFDKIKTKTPEAPSPEVSKEPELKKETPDSAAFEKVRTEWRQARERANALEQEYQDKYKKHILKQSEGLRGIANLPHRMLGFRPKLTAELEALQGASLIARRGYKEAGIKLKEVGAADGKLAERYQRLLAYHLTVAVHKERLTKQKDAAAEAWGASRIRPVMEALDKHKYARIGVMTLGYGVLAGATGGIGAAAVGGGVYLGRIAAAIGIGAGVGLVGQATYVEGARKKLESARKNIGDDFFDKDFLAADQEMSELTFEVSAREARTRTAAMAAGLAVGITENPFEAKSSSVTDVPYSANAPLERTVTGSTDAGPISVPDSIEEVNSVDDIPNEETTSTPDSVGDSIDQDPAPESEVETTSQPGKFEPMVGRADGDTTDMSRSSGSGVDRVPMSVPETADRSISYAELATEAQPKTRDYSLPPFGSISDLPSQGIVETAPVLPQVESVNANLAPLTSAEEATAFGPVEGPLVESLTTPDTIFHTVERGQNVWNILEGTGQDANPVGGKSEVLQGMLLAERQAALDKLVEYYEAHPEEAMEAGVVKSEGNIHKVYPGEQLNISVFDNKLRELLGIDVNVPVEASPAPVEVPQPEAVSTPEVSATETLIPEISVTDTSDLPSDSVDTLPAIDDQSVTETEAAPVENNSGAEALAESNATAVRSYVTEVEKSTGGFLFSGRPSVAGSFEALQNMTLGEFKALAANDNLTAELANRGVSLEGFTRWGETLAEQVNLVPADDNETLNQYLTRVVVNSRTA